MTDTARLLVEARRTATLARTALKDRKDAGPFFADALEAREQATALDPDYADPAWDEDLIGQNIQGLGRSRKRDARLSTVGLRQAQNTDLLNYFRLQLGIISNPSTVSSQLEDITAPDDWRTVAAGVPPCKTCAHDEKDHTLGVGHCLPPCDCEAYVASVCRHRWLDAGSKRTCNDCGERQQLFPTVAVEDTLAHQQFLKEQKGQA